MPSIQGATPKLSGKAQEQRFDLVVNDAPMNQVLSGLVVGTDYNMLIKPNAEAPLPTTGNSTGTAAPQGDRKISLNLKNVTLFEALDAIREIYGIDYSVAGRRILVQPADLQTRLYQVNYILGQRRGVSDIQVVSGASGGRSSGTGSSESNFASIQASGLSTTVKSDVWAEAEDALRTVLSCNIPRVTASAATTTTNSSTSSAGASRADVSHPGSPGSGERLRGIDGCSGGRALNINQMSGTILVRGMPSELRMVEQLLKSMQLNISRQVIIEAKIIDVELNRESQQGINWTAFRNGQHRFSVGADASRLTANKLAASSLTTTSASSSTTSSTVTAVQNLTLGDLLGSGLSGAGALPSGLSMAVQINNFAALIEFLETQGKLFVLSSPRIATLNNQKAVLKVGKEEPFVTNITGGSSNISNGVTVTTPPSLTYQPFFDGIALDVTPQIDGEDNITLHVHSMVNTIRQVSKIAIPNSNALVPFAQNTINETDSVVKARDGQVIVIGGLMTESTDDLRSGIPGVKDVPAAGNLFKKGAQASIKRELVILLKPTVVKDDTTWADDIAASGQRIRAISSGETTGMPALLPRTAP